MEGTFNASLIEAMNPKTSPERLKQLSKWNHYDQRNQLRKAIAANPNTEYALLWELAAEHPKELIENSKFQSLQFSNQPWWESCEPVGCLKLLAELGKSAPSKGREYIIQMLSTRLLTMEPLAMNMEWHMSFSEHVIIKWEPKSRKALDCDTNHKNAKKEALNNQAQEFRIHFSCVVEENLYFLRPPSDIKNSLELLIRLADAKPEEVLSTLQAHGWEAEFDSTPGGQGFWRIESIDPDIDNWDIEADLDGNAAGTVQITDPDGVTHDVEIESPDDWEDQYLNPILKDRIDMLSIFFDSTEDPESLRAPLIKVLTAARDN